MERRENLQRRSFKLGILRHPAVWLSVGLHGAFLLLPMPSSPSHSSLDALEQKGIAELQIPLTKLSPAPTPPVPVPSAQPSPKAIASSPTPRQPAIAPVRSNPGVAPSSAPAPASPIAQSPTSAPSPVASAAPSPEPSSTPSPAPEPSPELSPEPSDPFANFPHPTTAQVGCYGLDACRQIESDVSFRETARSLLEAMEEQGYEVKLREDLEEAGKKVYEVSRDGKTQFLSVLSADLGRTVYVLAAEPISLTELTQTPEG